MSAKRSIFRLYIIFNKDNLYVIRLPNTKNCHLRGCPDPCKNS